VPSPEGGKVDIDYSMFTNVCRFRDGSGGFKLDFVPLAIGKAESETCKTLRGGLEELDEFLASLATLSVSFFTNSVSSATCFSSSAMR